MYRPVQVLVFLFPILSICVKSGGSTIYGLLFLAGLLFGWQAWQNLKQWEKQIFFGFIVFFSVLLLGLINTEDYDVATSRFERFLRFLYIIPVYLLFRQLKIETAQFFLWGAMAACIVVVGQVWYEASVLHHTVVQGPYNKIVIGDITIFLVTIVFVGLVTLPYSNWLRVISILCIISGVYACIMADARGAWLAVPILFFLNMWLFRDRLGRTTWFRIAGVAVAFALILSIWPPEQLRNGIQRGIHDLKVYQLDPAKGSSWGVRINMWYDSVSLFLDHPIVGVGVGDYALERERLMAEGRAISGISYGHAHNIFLHTLATAGITGFLVLVICLFWLPFNTFCRFWSDSKKSHCSWSNFYLLSAMSLLICFAVFGLSEAWLTRSPMVNTFVLPLGIFMSSFAIRNDTQQTTDAAKLVEPSPA